MMWIIAGVTHRSASAMAKFLPEPKKTAFAWNFSGFLSARATGTRCASHAMRSVLFLTGFTGVDTATTTGEFLSGALG